MSKQQEEPTKKVDQKDKDLVVEGEKEKEKEKQSKTILSERAVSQKDMKQIQKISSGVKKFKKVIRSHHLQRVYTLLVPQSQVSFQNSPDFDLTFSEEFELPKAILPKFQKTIELDFYVQTLYLSWLVQTKQIQEAQNVAQNLISRVLELNRRYLDTLTSIIYFYLSRSYEIIGNLESIREYYNYNDEYNRILLQGYRNCCLNHDEQGQAVLLNLILRNFLHYNQYDFAFNFVNKCEFPEQQSGNENVRFLYYTGKIKAVRGEYSDSLSRLNQALRKAPDNTAYGFKVEVQKLACLVELLQGDIPNRDMFAQPQFQGPLYPYYMIVSSVIKGNLLMFKEIIRQYEQIFLKDKLYNIIHRLHQIVIKTGLRRINLSYSRITLADIKEKLKLPVESNAELIVAKAIRDGTLNAVIDHENQFIITKERYDLYGTTEPQQSFAKRINYCINVHNQAVKALQYHNNQIEYAEQVNTDELTAEELLNMVEMDDF